MKEFVIQAAEAGQRFDKYIAKVLPNANTSFYYKMLRKKNITLNGKKADGKEKIVQGDIVKFFLSDETFDKFAAPKAVNKKLDISKSGLTVLYEDDDILAFHKPAGLLSQKADTKDISVNDYLLAYLNASSEQCVTTFKPSICNRLDRNTSGIILCSKSMSGSQELGSLLKDRTLQKYYRCIVLGKMDTEHLAGYIKKDSKTNKITFQSEFFDGSDRIETAWKPVRSLTVLGQQCTELEVHLITGKTHQIRGHLAGVGHPILGDYKYGNRNMNEACKNRYGLSHQLLHAYKVVFPTHLNKLKQCEGLTIKAPLPEIFYKL